MPDDLPPLDELYDESLILEDGSIADVSYEDGDDRKGESAVKPAPSGEGRLRRRESTTNGVQMKSASRLRRKTPSADEDEDPDPDELADLIADILGGIYGDDAIDLIDDLEDAPEDGTKTYAGLVKGWSEIDHPRGPGGKFIAKHSAEARTSAGDAIKTALKAPQSPEGLKSLTEHLSILTVAQLRALKKEHGLSASPRLKAELVAKLAARLHEATAANKAPEPPKSKEIPLDISNEDVTIKEESKQVSREGEKVVATKKIPLPFKKDQYGYSVLDLTPEKVRLRALRAGADDEFKTYADLHQEWNRLNEARQDAEFTLTQQDPHDEGVSEDEWRSGWAIGGRDDQMDPDDIPEQMNWHRAYDRREEAKETQRDFERSQLYPAARALLVRIAANEADERKAGAGDVAPKAGFTDADREEAKKLRASAFDEQRAANERYSKLHAARVTDHRLEMAQHDLDNANHRARVAGSWHNHVVHGDPLPEGFGKPRGA